MFGDSGLRLASIVIGVIFIIGLIVLANRFGGQIRQRLQTTRVATTTITPTPQEVITPAKPETFSQIVGQTKGAITPSDISQIPDTGAETFVIPILFSLFGIGMKLRKIRLN